MNVRVLMPALSARPIPSRGPRSSGLSRLRGPYALVLLLMVLALLASWVALVYPMENSELYMDPTLGQLVMTRAATTLYYAAHGAAIG